MRKIFSEWVNYLNDAKHVSRTQNLFGIRMLDVKDANSSFDPDYSNGKLDKPSKKGSIKSVQLQEKKCYYLVENKLAYWFFQFITRMGNEIFYITFLPTLVWLYNERIMHLTCFSWAICMYIGQATKDLIKYPRPATPPVVKIEQKYILEYGFPSTHTMAAVNISYTLIRLTFAEYPLEENWFFGVVTVLIALGCIFFVSLSRIYLGMHSYLDVIGGLLYSLFISDLFLKVSYLFVDAIDNGFYTGLLVDFLLIAVCFLYPNKVRWSPARADTFLIMGVGIGVLLGATVRHNTPQLANQGIVGASPSVNLVLKRSSVGLAFLVAQRFVTKTIVYYLFKLLFQSNKTEYNFKSLIQTNYKLEMFYYIFVYGGIGFSASAICFCLFEYLKLV